MPRAFGASELALTSALLFADMLPLRLKAVLLLAEAEIGGKWTDMSGPRLQAGQERFQNSATQ